jgi:hypothetical protein
MSRRDIGQGNVVKCGGSSVGIVESVSSVCGQRRSCDVIYFGRTLDGGFWQCTGTDGVEYLAEDLMEYEENQ